MMADLYIDIEYRFAKPVDGPRVVIGTNVKRELVGDLLADCIRDQAGRGLDERKAVERDVYHIRIEVDLSCDEFTTTSDTGNDGLTCGIVLDVFRRLDQPGEVEFS
jgi:hypothetical protein